MVFESQSLTYGRIGGNQQKIEEDVAEATRLFNQELTRFEDEEELAQVRINLSNPLRAKIFD